jgi:hypothetical protein
MLNHQTASMLLLVLLLPLSCLLAAVLLLCPLLLWTQGMRVRSDGPQLISQLITKYLAMPTHSIAAASAPATDAVACIVTLAGHARALGWAAADQPAHHQVPDH